MKVYKAITEEKPSKSGEYRVKTDGLGVGIKYAHYNVEHDEWWEDGTWSLPVTITPCVTHWAELKGK